MTASMGRYVAIRPWGKVVEYMQTSEVITYSGEMHSVPERQGINFRDRGVGNQSRIAGLECEPCVNAAQKGEPWSFGYHTY